MARCCFSEASNVADVVGFMAWFRVVLLERGRWRQKDFLGCRGFCGATGADDGVDLLDGQGD